MQSSIWVFLRTLVVLACLAGMAVVAYQNVPLSRDLLADAPDALGRLMDEVDGARPETFDVAPSTVTPQHIAHTSAPPGRSITPPPVSPVSLAIEISDEESAPVAVESIEHFSPPFESIELRLRDLGATEYALQTWGSSGRLVRFHCRVAYDENLALHRHFQAVDAEPLVAMNRVLQQVQAWRTRQSE